MVARMKQQVRRQNRAMHPPTLMHKSQCLQGAVEQIKQLGGGRIEGYPENTEGRKASPAFLFNGALSTFERQGFKRSRQIGKNKWVVERTVRKARRS